MLVDTDLSLEILSAITLSLVLIHNELMPTLKQIRSPQKNLARAQLIIEFFSNMCCPFFCAHDVSNAQDNSVWIFGIQFVVGVKC